ncbi:hypothetical protein IFM46972_05392 [Aspergillus udagawae]|uniref:Uncharacterized protein n=1 Tax=Aspergillus udagawae TaxID=91492 RepID=A0A8H3RU24_9EURO|nr:hypothetical protein IFM46972_05392 [Aspergillus udagawae]
MRATAFALLTALSASLVHAQGYSKECSNIYLNEGWLVATCPTDGDNGSITSSVYLPNKIANINAVLEISQRSLLELLQGLLAHQQRVNTAMLVQRFTISVQKHNIKSRQGPQTYVDISTNSLAEEHIANYEGHLLSNLTGAVTTVPADSSHPVPSDFEMELELSTLNNSCAKYGGTITLNRPTSCYYLNIGVEYSWACGNSVNNHGWEIVGYSDKDCKSAPVATFTQENQGTCLTFSTGVKGFSMTPLWNAD